MKTFKENAECEFISYLKRQLSHVARMNVEWDTYKADCFKEHTIEGRGTKEILRVSERIQLPHNWKSFLHVDIKNMEIFRFLATIIKSESTAPRKMLITTKGQNVASSPTLDVSVLQSCLH